MKVIALNSSPRKGWNTEMILKKALEGAESAGSKTEYIHLNDLNYKGCQSCFLCKTRGGESYGKCGYKDDLTPILNKIEESDAFILGSPIYMGDVPGMMRSLLERLLFPRYEYTKTPLLSPRRIKNAHVYTMNVNDEFMEGWLKPKFDEIQGMYDRIVGPAETLAVTKTLQWNDYSKYVSDGIDEAEKKQSRKEKFPKDLESAFELGKRLAS